MTRTAALLGILLIGTLAQPALPQAATIAGGVIDSAGRQPLSGAVIQVYGEGELRGRGLSDAQGEFRIRPSGPVDEFRVVRIGFRPQTQRLAALSAASLRVEFQMQRIPAFLDPVRVVAAQCGGRRVRGPSPVALIEQARAGLLATIVSREQNPARMVRILYERHGTNLTGRGGAQHVRLDTATAAIRSFSAVHDAEGFVRRGFLEEIDGEQVYYAPDAEVLLADEFAAGYCFHVVPRVRDRPNQVGLGFDAADRRRGRVDVTGVLWIDTLARELREIEFRYVGLNRYFEQLRPGGNVAFRALPNGMVVIDDWSLTLVGMQTDSVADQGARGRATTRVILVRSGGVLAEAEWRDGTRWRATLPTLEGLARWGDGQPAAGVQLSLRGTPFAARTDSAGAFRFENIVPGRYEILAMDEELLAIGLATRTSAIVDVGAAGLSTAPVMVPRRDGEVAQRCLEAGAQNVNNNSTMLLARALHDDGTPVAGAEWNVRVVDHTGWRDAATDGLTGGDGVILVCTRLLRGAEFELTVRAAGDLTNVQRGTLTHRATVLGVVFPRR